MEIRISVQNAGREIALESDQSTNEVTALIDKAIASGELLSLTDNKGRTIIVPGDKIAFIEIGAQQPGRVGFSN